MFIVVCISLLLLWCTAAALQVPPLPAFRTRGHRQWVRESPRGLSRSPGASFHRTMCATSEDSPAVASTAAAKNIVAPSPGHMVLFASTMRRLLEENAHWTAAVALFAAACLSDDIKISLGKIVGFGVTFALIAGFIGVAALMGAFLGLGLAAAAADFFDWLMGDSSKKQTVQEALQEVEDLKDFLAHAITNSKVVLSKEKMDAFVHRPALEETLVKKFNAPPEGMYTTIYGANGVGKTSVVEHLAAGREGVVMLRYMEAVNSREDVVSQLVKMFTDTKSPLRNCIDMLIDAISRCEKVPTIIFDVDRGVDLDCVRNVCKNLAEYSRSFIILSGEAAAEAELFWRDHARERMLFVDEMTVDEAKTLLKLKLKPDQSLSEETMNRVFETIGTNAAHLIMFCSDVNDGYSVDEILKSKLGQAKDALHSFPFKKILKELKEHPEGVRVDNFRGVIEDGIDLGNWNDVTRATKKDNVILFRERRLRYQLASTDLKTALKTYDIPG